MRKLIFAAVLLGILATAGFSYTKKAPVNTPGIGNPICPACG